MPLPYRDAGNYISTVIVSPRTGIPMDLTVSDTCGTVSVSLVATTKLVALPTDLFSQGDFMSGVNYIAPIKVVNS
jgi:outer membrane lipoprotein-sorting protein